MKKSNVKSQYIPQAKPSRLDIVGAFYLMHSPIKVFRKLQSCIRDLPRFL